MRTLADGSREVLCCAVDISERSRNEHRLLEKSRKDPLTGCYNRRHLAAFQTDAKPGASWASVVIDIDHLKRYNDTYGHRAGDQAIVRLARFLERIVRKDDSIVRLGGDEFVILLQQCDPVTLESFAVRLQGALATQETVPFSYGLAMRKNDEELELTIHRADRQMIERRIIERSSIRLDVPREARRSEARRSVIRIHPEVGSVQAEPISTPSLEAEG
jgi:diguanylate cyclase (GGDEF)-like protein